MRLLSKSKILAYRQCPRRLWLEVHRPELLNHPPTAETRFAIGHTVGEIARQIYDPPHRGTLVDIEASGFEAAFSQTTELVKAGQPVFEAGFRAGGALAFADVLLPLGGEGRRAWRMVEVKSSTSVKDYHRDDVALQAWVARQAGLPLAGVAVAHIDSDWVYPGGGDYAGLLAEVDLSAEALGRGKEAAGWIAAAQDVMARRDEPAIAVGPHCSEPFDCGFSEHCRAGQPKAEYPVEWLPRIQSRALKAHIEAEGVTDMRAVPDALLTETQRRVKAHTLSGEVYFDRAGAAADLAAHALPAFFLDFETVVLPIPRWAGTRPYQQIPFQFSCHRLGRRGRLEYRAFLDTSGADPSQPFVEALLAACGERGPVFVYNAGFETARIRELAERFPAHARALLAINARIVDLLPVARERFYHPDQAGSWSIKAVLPAVAPELSYASLDGVRDGGMAMEAYQEAIAPNTGARRRDEIRCQLLAYCALDTLAMVHLWAAFSGRGSAVFPGAAE